MESEKNVPLEDQNVPAAHQGLHGFLYSSEDEHGSTTSSLPVVPEGAEVVPVENWRSHTHRVKVAGVYAVLDADHQTQYIGYSRDVQQSLEGHIAQHGVEACAFIRVQTFKFPTRQAMEALRDEWLAALDQVPSGNQMGEGTWAKTIGEVAQASMSAAERQAYEEKKLKLRKAMADNTLSHELDAQAAPDESEAERRRKLKAAVENDNWSGVVES
ncbi:GIY-YIG nuclease family protein [Trichocoleus sp. FACHB-262]|uniref:GIY-YIG nuclease family protein n=1 Tax=Trichocoleus sp. FACHB-262 TaxID=2692869 RepID=UPI0016860D2D|nr:GIY-YIG nuclease family protein [Trichocoleus sp. FACHB-262]MBD2121144.1 GIY-YIG nuclease family protein [Trichocoleus sp. FACHB-262]